MVSPSKIKFVGFSCLCIVVGGDSFFDLLVVVGSDTYFDLVRTAVVEHSGGHLVAVMVSPLKIKFFGFSFLRSVVGGDFY